jgi:hypothetical protein
MKRILLATTMLAAIPAFAADNAIVLTPGSGVVERSVDTTGAGGPQSPMVVLGSSLGVAIYGTPGAPPAGTNVLTVQGIAAMTPLLVTATQSGTWNVNATQTGTWTVQPGNTANTTAWLVTGTGGTFPSTAAAAAYVDGWDATQGTKVDAAWTTGSGSVVAVLKAIDRDVLTPATLTPAGGAAPTSNVSCGGATTPCQIKNGAGNFYGAYATCTAACWLFIINTTTTPVNATLTVGTASGNLADCVPIAAGLAGSVSYPTFPRAFSVGIYAAVSSTACPVLTLVAPILVTGQAQ